MILDQVEGVSGQALVIGRLVDVRKNGIVVDMTLSLSGTS